MSQNNLTTRPTKSILLAALDAKLYGIEEAGRQSEATTHPLRTSNQINRAQSSLTTTSTSIALLKPPSTARDKQDLLSKVMSEVSITAKPISRTQSGASTASTSKRTYKKSGGTSVQVDYPIYSYRDKELSVPHPPPKCRYIRDIFEANDAALNLDTSSGLGFDLEWKISYGPTQRPTAVLQICDRSSILVIQLSAMGGKFPVQIKAILENPKIPKLGVNILNDGIRIAKDFAFRPQGLVELGGLARQADPGPKGYLEKYFRVTNPEYAVTYLESLETPKVDMATESQVAANDEKVDSTDTPSTQTNTAEEGSTTAVATIPNIPRKPGAMIALATVTAMYTQRVLAKGPVRSSNWETNPLSGQQIEYAASDAHCALVIYNRLMQLAVENKVTLEPEKYTHDVKFIPGQPNPSEVRKPASTSVASVPGSSMQSQISNTSSGAGMSRSNSKNDELLEDEDEEKEDVYQGTSPSEMPSSSNATSGTIRQATEDPLPNASAPKRAKPNSNAPIAEKAKKWSGPMKMRPQYSRAYSLWYEKQMPLDEMRKVLRIVRPGAKEGPLTAGTVIAYIIGALQADPSLRFEYTAVKTLLEKDKSTMTRNKEWFESLSANGHAHSNMVKN